MMRKAIAVIPATKRVGSRAREEERQKIRVAAYCRVSTETDEQATSYEAQIEHYTEYIKKNPTWEFAGIEKILGDDNSGPVAELNRQIGEQEQQILQRTRAKQDCDDLGQEVIRLREEKYQLQLEDATKESTRQKIAELEKVIAEIGGKVEEYEEVLVRKLIERITVYDDYFTVEFKSGIEIDVRL